MNIDMRGIGRGVNRTCPQMACGKLTLTATNEADPLILAMLARVTSGTGVKSSHPWQDLYNWLLTQVDNPNVFELPQR